MVKSLVTGLEAVFLVNIQEFMFSEIILTLTSFARKVPAPSLQWGLCDEVQKFKVSEFHGLLSFFREPFLQVVFEHSRFLIYF